MKRYFGKSALFSLAAAAAVILLSALWSCNGLNDDAAIQNSLLFAATQGAGQKGGTEAASAGGPVDGAAASGIVWAGVQTLSGEVSQEGVFPAEYSVAPDSVGGRIPATSAGMTGGGVSGNASGDEMSLSGNASSHSIFPTAPTASTLTYTVSASATINERAVSATGSYDKGTGKYSIELPYATGGTVWSVTIEAKNSSGKIVLKKTEPITINSRTPAAAPFKLEYSSNSEDGTGNVTFDISWTPSDIDELVLYWNDAPETLSLSPSTTTFTYDKSDVAPGSYDIKILFYRNGAVVYAIGVEKVNVYANMTSNKFFGSAPHITSSGKINVTDTCISALKSVSEGGIWVGGYGIVDSSEAKDANDGSKFAPVATLYRAFQIANSLAELDSTKTYTIKVQGNVKAGTSANATASLSANAKVLLEGTSTSASSYKQIQGSGGDYKISTSSPSLTCKYLIFDYLGGFTVAAGETTMNYCTVQNGQSSSATSAAGITIASGATFSSTASLAITGCANSVASGCGGGIYCAGTLDLAGTTIKNCKATGTGGCGGGIYVTGTAATVTLDGCSIGVDAATPATASSLSLCSNYAAGKGGGIYIDNSSSTGVTLKNSTNVSYNYAANGGGIYANDGKLSLSKTTVQRNGTASKGCGGGIYIKDAALSFADANSVISYNSVGTAQYAYGGGLYISDFASAAITIKGTFNGNTAYGGGGIYNASTELVALTTCTVGDDGAGNVGKYGGGVYNSGTKLTLNGATIQCNNDATQGGGVYNAIGHTLVVFGSTKIQNNKDATSKGGGIYNSGTLCVYGAATISGNSTKGYGGGVYCDSLSQTRLGYNAEGSPSSWTGSISANEAASYFGGGLFMDTTGGLSMASGTIGGASADLGNKAKRGAGLYFDNTGSVSITGGTIQYNEASESGGGVYVNSGTPKICATISNNSATESGGGIYNRSKLTVTAATFKANTASKGSDIYYLYPSGYTASLTLSGTNTIGSYASDRLKVHLANSNSAIALDSSFSTSKGKVELTPDQAGGMTIGKNVLSSGVTSTNIKNFVLPASMSDVYRLLQNSAAAKLDLQPVSLKTITGRTVSTRPKASSTASDYVTSGAFAHADTESVVVRSISMAQYEVNYELWYAIYQWATHRATNSYTFGSYGKEGVDAFASTDGTPPSESVPPTTTTVNSGEGRGGQRPVTFVSWRDAVVWCNAYSEYMGLTPVYYTDSTYATPLRSCTNATTYTVDEAGKQDCPYIYAGSSNPGNIDMANCIANGARLPTEAEWEYAARGGNPTATAWNYTYAGGDTLTSIAWIKDANSLFHCVGKKNANALSLYDMTGNNTEWCHDWNNKTASTPTRVEKGGCAANESTSGNLKIENRGGSHPARFGQRSGFRFVQNN